MSSRISYSDEGNKKLILLEKKDHVIDCLSWLEKVDGQKLIIGLSPSATYELDLNKIPYNIPEDYYSCRELYDVGINNFEKVERLCTIIDDEIKQSCSQASDFNLTPAIFSYYHLKMIYDAMVIRIFQLGKIIDSEKPDVIYIYFCEKYPFGAYSSAPYISFDLRECIYSQLLSIDQWKIPVKIIPCPKKLENNSVSRKETVKKLKLKEVLKTSLLDYPEFYDLALGLKQKGFPGVLNWLKSSIGTEKYPLLLYGGGYNWDDSHEELRRKGMRPIYRLEESLIWLDRSKDQEYDVLDHVWTKLQKDEGLRDILSYGGIDFFPVLESRLQFLVKKITIACIIAAKEIMAFIDKKKIKALIASTLATSDGHSVAKAAHNKNIPVITWQHGAYGAMKHPIVDYCDLISSDVHLVFGSGVSERYKQSSKRFNTKLEIIGSPSLKKYFNLHTTDESSATYNSKKETVLYITTAARLTNNYVSEPYLFSDNHLFKCQKKIIDSLAKHPTNNAIVKLHPAAGLNTPIEEYTRNQNIRNCTFIRNEETVLDLLPRSDIIIIDLPSTVLLQSLATNKIIFTYTGYLQVDGIATKLLKRRAFCSDNIDLFAKEIDSYLSTGKTDYSFNLDDREFLKQYGISDFNCEEKAAKALKNLILTGKSST